MSPITTLCAKKLSACDTSHRDNAARSFVAVVRVHEPLLSLAWQRQKGIQNVRLELGTGKLIASTVLPNFPKVGYARPSHVWSAKEAARNVRAFTNEGASSSPRLIETFPKDFDLDLAVALSECAFHAYKSPTQDDLFTICNEKNTTVTYMNRRIPPTDCVGVLEVHLKGASGLRDADSLMGKSDPYAILSVGKSNTCSKRVDGSLNPSWNQTFCFLVRNADEEMLRVQVWDYDSLGADDDLGFAQIQVKDLKQGSMQDIELELGGQGEGGIVKLAAMYKPLQEVFNTSNEGQPSVKADSSNASDRKVTQICGSFVTPACFIENTDTDTQAWVHCTDFDSDHKELVISFRGTEISKSQDLVTDESVFPTKLDEDLFQALKQDKIIESMKSKRCVHQGFSTAYASVKETVKDVVNWITGGSSDWKVYVTGHSLGAALGTLCALDLNTRESTHRKVEMYNYGSPRVGTADFAAACNVATPIAWRIKTKEDPVTEVPYFQGLYTHAGRAVTIRKDCVVEFGEPEKPENSWIKVLGALGKLLIEQRLADNPIFQEEVGRVLGVFDAPQHLQDEYKKRLTGVVKRCMG